MGMRAHVHTKHVIEYGGCHFNWASDIIHDWLIDNGVCGFGDGSDYDGGSEWEFYKGDLRNIPEDAYKDIEGRGEVIKADELREFVKELLDAPTGEYAYVSWF